MERQGARIRVYWQPGCTSCLRTKEFLARQGIAFQSIDVTTTAGAREQLIQLGARGLPVVALGDRFTLCQSFGDVLEFLDLRVSLDGPLPPAELVARIDRVLSSAARYTLQFDAAQLKQTFRNRNRTIGATAFHLFRVAEMFLDATQGKELRVEGFNDQPPAHWKGEDIVRWGLEVRAPMQQWWQQQTDRELQTTLPTYYGQRKCHDVLERTAYHTAQHARQLILMLESVGTPADDPLTPADLAGLPVPEQVWG